MARPKTLRTPIYSEQQYKDAITQSKGNISAVARILGLVRVTVDDRIRNNPELKKFVVQERESKTDMGEQIIYDVMYDELAETKDRLDAAKYWLNHMGRSRGWGDVTTNININANLDIDFDTSQYSIEEKRELLEKLDRGMKKEDEDIIDGNFIGNENNSESSFNNS